MREIETLAALPADAARRLRGAGIETVDDLWSRLGSRDSQDEFHLQLASLAVASGLTPSHLLNLLADEAVYEVRWGDYARLGRGGPSALVRWFWGWQRNLGAELREVLRQRPRVFLGRQWLDVMVTVVLLLGLFLFVTTRLLPVLGAEREAGLIASHNLEPGQVLRSGDWVERRWLPVTGDRLSASTDPAGWLTTRKVYGGQPLRHADLERHQVVAARDLAAGETLTRDSVELVLSAAVADALLTGAGVSGKRARWKIVAGTVITDNLLDAPPPRVIATGWLPAFRVLREGDVAGDPAGPSTDELVRKVEGQLTFRDLAAGEAVDGALLALRFSTADLADRRVIPLDALAAGFELRAGSRVSLWVTPARDTEEAFEIGDVLVLRPAGEVPALVALTTAEFTRLAPWLGRSKIAAYQMVSAP